MATTGTPLYPGSSTFPGSSTYPGQGAYPLMESRLSTSAPNESVKVWTPIVGKLREYQITRGRESDIAQVNAATLVATYDNRNRDLDPTNASGPFAPSLRPGNAIWLRAGFSGEYQDRFVGYVTNYEQRWPAGSKDAETIIHASDEISRLSRLKLPVMDPPSAATYADAVKADLPAGYWRFSDFNNLSGDPGPAWTVPASGGYGIANASGVVGDNVGSGSGASGCLAMNGTSAQIENSNEAFDTQALSVMTVEFWFRYTALPGAEAQIIGGRVNAAGTARNFSFNLMTTGALKFTAANTTPTGHVVTSSALAVNTWYYIVGRVDGSFAKIYVNGVEAASTAFTGTLLTNNDDVSTTSFPFMQGIASLTFNIDELAFYPRDIGTARISAHYVAGSARGFPRSQYPPVRAIAVLDAAESHAPRSISGTSRAMQGSFMHGQPPIEELREAERGELADGVLFVTRDGTIKLLSSGHRGAAPYDTVQATFERPGTSNLDYTDVSVEFSDAGLVNIWHGERQGGQLQTASNPTSIEQNDEQPDTITGLRLEDDADVLTIVQSLLDKTKDSTYRIVGFTAHTADPDTAQALLRLDIGDRVRVLWTPPAGGSQIDQTSFVQKISESGSRDSPVWSFNIGISAAAGPTGSSRG